MLFNEEKQKEIRDLIIQFARLHVSPAFEYKVEFEENDAGQAITAFSIIKDNKEFSKIVNIMTLQGFQEMENRKGWTAWAVELCELMKKAIFQKAIEPKKNWFKRLFSKK